MSLVDLANQGYTNINNTLLGESQVNAPLTALALQGNQPIADISTSGGSVSYQLSPALWQQGIQSQLLIHNSAGANSINLIAASSSSSSGVQGFALQQSLGLPQVGNVALLKVIRTGSGTASVQVNGTTVITSTGTVSLVTVQATQVNGSTGACQVNTLVVV